MSGQCWVVTWNPVHRVADGLRHALASPLPLAAQPSRTTAEADRRGQLTGDEVEL
jgi:hypothetical protein